MQDLSTILMLCCPGIKTILLRCNNLSTEGIEYIRNGILEGNSNSLTTIGLESIYILYLLYYYLLDCDIGAKGHEVLMELCNSCPELKIV